MSLPGGSEILPAVLTTTSMVNSLSPQTETFSTSSGPMRYCGETDDPACPALDDCARPAGGFFAAIVGSEPGFVKVIGGSGGGTAVEAGAGGIGFFSVLASDTGGSIAATVGEEATLHAGAGFYSGTFGVTVALGISFPVFSLGGTDEDTDSKDDRYRSADAGSRLFFLGGEASRDFDRDDADGEREGFRADAVAGGAAGGGGGAGGGKGARWPES